MSAVSDSYPFNGEVYFLPVILQFSKDLNILPHKLIPSVDCMCISDSTTPIHGCPHPLWCSRTFLPKWVSFDTHAYINHKNIFKITKSNQYSPCM